MMVKHATQLDLKTDVVHESYKTSKEKLAQSFRLGKHTTGIDARGRCETWVPLGPHRPGSRPSPTSGSGLLEDPPTCYWTQPT
jgi:hypothetical protein